MKIAVYAICKNEEKFIESWIQNVYQADEIILCDTGSTDNTISLAKKYDKVKIFNINVSPFRFDVARNVSLSLVSSDMDVCVCTDIDERLCDNWRELIEQSWTPNVTTKLKYTYNWSFDENNNPLVTFLYEKIHARHNFYWRHPVHEVLYYYGDKENVSVNENLILNHYPDSTKSRSNYLPLLELSVKLYPQDDRNCFYLGREYTFYEMWEKAIDTFQKHLKLPSAIWDMERNYSYRLLAKSYRKLNRLNEALSAAKQACIEYSDLRENYIELCEIYMAMGDFNKALSNIKKCLTITDKPKVYMNDPDAWNYKVYDLCALSAYYAGHYEEAYNFGKIALSLFPSSERLKKNMEFYIEKNK